MLDPPNLLILRVVPTNLCGSPLYGTFRDILLVRESCGELSPVNTGPWPVCQMMLAAEFDTPEG